MNRKAFNIIVLMEICGIHDALRYVLACKLASGICLVSFHNALSTEYLPRKYTMSP
jgi:hypothetical protein